MDDGDGGEHSQDPQHRGHGAPLLEQSADDDQHDALWPLHEADLTTSDERLGAGAGVADHDGADHHKRHQPYIEEAVSAGVVDQEPEEEGDV